MIPSPSRPPGRIHIGWGHADMTPSGPVLIAGQFHARVSEGVLDPITVTALALEEEGGGAVIFVSCDISLMSEGLRGAVDEVLAARVAPAKVIYNVTHTHTGPSVNGGRYGERSAGDKGYPLPVESTEATIARMAPIIADTIEAAWSRRAPGAIAFGLGQAVISRNRRWVDTEGKSTMYGDIATAAFSHPEGYEDHDLNLVATYDSDGGLTGLLINVAAPSQVREHLYVLSADFWAETRQEVRRRFGDGVHVLAQCSPAGDLAPLRPSRHLYNTRAQERMFALHSREACDEIAHRICNAVGEILPVIGPARLEMLSLVHEREVLELPLNPVGEADAGEAAREMEHFRRLYEGERDRLQADASLREEPRWYTQVTRYYAWMLRHQRVVERFERQAERSCWPVELDLVRLGEIAFATNPFEYYLDYALAIKARSPAVQTFLIQLCGAGSYLPSRRSLKGGGYGSVPASNIFGPDAGDQLKEAMLQGLNALWEQGEQ